MDEERGEVVIEERVLLTEVEVVAVVRVVTVVAVATMALIAAVIPCAGTNWKFA
jgi:hypothetical protein